MWLGDAGGGTLRATQRGVPTRVLKMITSEFLVLLKMSLHTSVSTLQLPGDRTSGICGQTRASLGYRLLLTQQHICPCLPQLATAHPALSPPPLRGDPGTPVCPSAWPCGCPAMWASSHFFDGGNRSIEFKNIKNALAQLLSCLEHRPMQQKVAGSIPSQGAYGKQPVMYLSLSPLFLSLSQIYTDIS